MNAETVELVGQIVPIVGVVVGALIAWGANALLARRREVVERRRALQDVLAELLNVTDRLWDLDGDVKDSIVEVQAARQAGQTADLDELDQRRRSALARRAEARADAERLVAVLALSAPEVERAAVDLAKCALTNANALGRHPAEIGYTQRRDEYVHASRKVLGVNSTRS